MTPPNAPAAKPGSPPALAWAALALAAALGALVVPSAAGSIDAIDWQRGLLRPEPWRLITAAFVHHGPIHLAANLAGCAVVGAFGAVARVPPVGALAWLAAWPATHALLAFVPGLDRYGGLSGVLHAGVAVAAVWLIANDRGRRRWVGTAVAAGLAVKVLLEAPWGPAARFDPAWDMAVVPAAHAFGALAGAIGATVAIAFGGLHRPPESGR
jgi:rhomboid family GlyGly-CTERM serine protease